MARLSLVWFKVNLPHNDRRLAPSDRFGDSANVDILSKVSQLGHYLFRLPFGLENEVKMN